MIDRRITIAAASALLAVQVAAACSAAPPPPEASSAASGAAPSTALAPADDGRGDAVDASRAAAVDAVFVELATDDGPGCAVAIGTNGRVAYEQGYGLADVAAGTPIGPETRFDVASVSKQLTAGAIMALVADGRLSLDDDIRTYVDELPDFGEVVTVGDLVHHTGGIDDYVDRLQDAGVELEDPSTDADALGVLADASELAFVPGTAFEYSNTGYFLLGQIVEAVTGQSLGEYSAAEVFDPLGLDRTVVRAGVDDRIESRARGYAADGDGGFAPAESPWTQTGDGGVHTTAGDLVRWTGALVGPTRREDGVGSAPWRALMVEPGPVPDTDGTGYGGGIVLTDIDGAPVLTHDGSWLGFSASLTVRVDDGRAVAVACNVDDLDADALATDALAAWESAG